MAQIAEAADQEIQMMKDYSDAKPSDFSIEQR